MAIDAIVLWAVFVSRYDYVSDVKWSPVNVNVFAAVTSSGDVLIYNLGKSISEHIVKLELAQVMSDINNTTIPSSGNSGTVLSYRLKDSTIRYRISNVRYS